MTRLPTHDKLETLTYTNLRFIISIEEIGIKLYGYWGKKTTRKMSNSELFQNLTFKVKL